MKPLFILLFSGCLITSYCKAQPLGTNETTIKTNNEKPPKQAFMVSVTFIADDTCNLTINNTDYKEVTKNKSVKLPLGTYKLFFESLETGKIIRDRSFRLTMDKVIAGKYTYSVTFDQ